MNYNYQKICQELLKDLPERQKEVISRRFGLETNQKETLESIGRDFDITRERVRQIEEAGFLRLKPKVKEYQKTFQYFINHLKTQGDLKKEDLLLTQLGGKKFQNQIFFLLTLADPFQRFSETKDFYSLWTINPHSLSRAQEIINSFYNQLKEINQPLSLEEFSPPAELRPNWRKYLGEGWVTSYLEISKIIQKNQEGLFGLKDWPEINPRGVKDKAYLVFKKIKTPLHYLEITKLIGPKALPQTVHNELIRDPRFVLVGRGLYALREWGYEEGNVKDIIFKVLKESSKPLSKEEVLEKVLKQRLVKENTVLLNLNNKKYFLKDSRGNYLIKKA